MAMDAWDIEKTLGELTLEEKASLVSGGDYWPTQAIERLGIPAVMMCDGPGGLRKQTEDADCMGIGRSIETTCYPSAASLGQEHPETCRQIPWRGMQTGKCGDAFRPRRQHQKIALMRQKF